MAGKRKTRKKTKKDMDLAEFSVRASPVLGPITVARPKTGSKIIKAARKLIRRAFHGR